MYLSLLALFLILLETSLDLIENILPVAGRNLPSIVSLESFLTPLNSEDLSLARMGDHPDRLFREEKPWMDKLRVLPKLAFEEGISARIFKATADPPTTSLQRLKGLTTGGLPTFIDVGNSFGAPAIIEDNLTYQVKKRKRVVMMGDDTWLQLFPAHFERSYPFPSFNVKDLQMGDDGCVDHLLPSLYQDD